MTLTTQKFLIVFAVMAALLWALFGPPAHAEDAAIGDSLAQGFGWGGNALLVGCFGTGGTDAGGDQYACWAGEGAQGCDLLRGADEAADSGFQTHFG